MYYNNTIMKIICDWNNCNKIGEYKAPIEKDNSKDFRYLCLEHIREFNKNWNYFANMTDKQINEFIKSNFSSFSHPYQVVTIFGANHPQRNNFVQALPDNSIQVWPL